MDKTAQGLAAFAKAQIGKPYWYACCGWKPTLGLLTSKVEQYPLMWNRDNRVERARAQIGKYDMVFDCIGLVKAYIWQDLPGKYDVRQDYSADGAATLCKAQPISGLPETPGALLFLPGHVGVYLGNGDVAEARGFDYGVVQTRLHGRGWQRWGCCPWVSYADQPLPPEEFPFRIGCEARFKPDARQYYPDGPAIPAWLKATTAITVAQVLYEGKPVVRGGRRCVLLGNGVATWCAAENLEEV